jgi:hypothetical protein
MKRQRRHNRVAGNRGPQKRSSDKRRAIGEGRWRIAIIPVEVDANHAPVSPVTDIALWAPVPTPRSTIAARRPALHRRDLNMAW